MEEVLEIVLRAIDEASNIFGSISDSAENMGDAIEDSTSEGSSGFDDLSDAVDGASGSVQDIIDYVNSIDNSSIDDAASSTDDLASGADNASNGLDNLANSAGNANNELQETASNIDAIMTAGFQMEVFSEISDSLMEFADAAGNYEDSITRLELAMSGIGVSADDASSAVSMLSSETGRSASSIRESFIMMSSVGITSMEAMEAMFEGASAQSFILGTDVESLARKYSTLAMSSNISERMLRNTGITIKELGEVLGMQGATIDEIKAKWETMSIDARAAAIGQAAAMNEGADANDAYRHSWEGLHNQLDMATAKLMRLAGEVLLPTLIPAIEIATGVLNALGSVVSWVMSSPLGGLISVLGSLAAAFVIVTTGVSLLSTLMSALNVVTTLNTIETIALAIAENGLSVSSIAAALGAQGLTLGLSEVAVAGWAAASAIWAALAPLLPFIAVGAAVALVIYEIGKSFNWWHDASTMIEAISDGLQRLWDAFINHPDVQAVIQALSAGWDYLANSISWAWEQVMNFIKSFTGGDFDLVHALIEAIGVAWQVMTFPIRTVISVVQYLVGVFQNAAGALSDFGIGWEVLLGPVGWFVDIGQFLIGVFQNIYNGLTSATEGMDLFNESLLLLTGPIGWIIYAVQNFTDLLNGSALEGVGNFVTGVWNWLSQIPGIVYNALMGAWNWITTVGVQWAVAGLKAAMDFMINVQVQMQQLPVKVALYLAQVLSRILSAGSQWVSSAISKASQVVQGVISQVSQLPGKVYNEFIKIGQKIRDSISSAVRAATQFGSDIVNAVLGALGIASPGTIQRKTTKEFKDTISNILGLGSDAYNAGQSYGESIVDGFNTVDLGSGLATDLNTGQLFDITTGQSYDVDTTQHIDGEITITHDLENVPDGVNEQQLAEMINRSTSNDEFMKRIAESVSFQRYDSREKLRIQRRDGRSKGVM